LVNQLNKSLVEKNEEQKAISRMLVDSVTNMKTIINELSEISKIEGNYTEPVETVRFENILKEVQLTLRDKINESKAHITLDIKEHEIQFSRKNLRSVLYNLLSNAIKYKHPTRDPEIHISTEKENGVLHLCIKDNGLGISSEKKDLIFTQFTRLEKEVEGTGIGLYLVKRILENEGGKIEVNSRVGEGSEFKVYLKLKV
jgi:two-component system phosphate regulon sensor histidine kinase PhoR